VATLSVDFSGLEIVRSQLQMAPTAPSTTARAPLTPVRNWRCSGYLVPAFLLSR